MARPLRAAQPGLVPVGLEHRAVPVDDLGGRGLPDPVAIAAGHLLEEGYDLVALGRAEPSPISEAALQERLDAAPRVKQSLKEVVLLSAANILGTYAGRGSDLAPWLADAEINRERHLRLQYLAGLAANTDQRMLIFQSILDYRRYPADLFIAATETEATLRGWYDK